MRKRVFFIIGMVFLSGCTPSLYFSQIKGLYQIKGEPKGETIVISERVGSTIEPEERERFDLFKGINGFKSAMFYEMPGGGYEAVILTENQKLAALNRDSLAIPILRDYINRYEEIKPSRVEFEKKWGIVDYDVLGQPITQWEVNHVNRGLYTTGCGTACCLLGIIPNAILGYIIGVMFSPAYLTYRCGAFFPEPNATVFWLVFISGNVLSTGIGVLCGDKLDKGYAIQAIKRARRPKVIE